MKRHIPVFISILLFSSFSFFNLFLQFSCSLPLASYFSSYFPFFSAHFSLYFSFINARISLQKTLFLILSNLLHNDKDNVKGNFFSCIYLFIYFYQLEANYFTILQWFLSYIDMNQPWIYMYSPSQTPLPPPNLPDPSGSSQCTRSEHLSHASNLGW